VESRSIKRLLGLSALALAVCGAAAWWIWGLTGYPHRAVVVLYVMSAVALIGSVLCQTWNVLRTLGYLYKARALLSFLMVLGFVLLLKDSGARVDPEEWRREMLDDVTQRVNELEKQREEDQARNEQLTSEIAEMNTVLEALKIPLPVAALGVLLAIVGTLLGVAASVVWAAGIA
jgi:hypothetical protein